MLYPSGMKSEINNKSTQKFSIIFKSRSLHLNTSFIKGGITENVTNFKKSCDKATTYQNL